MDTWPSTSMFHRSSPRNGARMNRVPPPTVTVPRRLQRGLQRERRSMDKGIMSRQVAELPFGPLDRNGFARVAVGVPKVRVVDPKPNVEATLTLAGLSNEHHALLIAFPELGLSSYTAGPNLLFGSNGVEHRRPAVDPPARADGRHLRMGVRRRACARPEHPARLNGDGSAPQPPTTLCRLLRTVVTSHLRSTGACECKRAIWNGSA